MTRGSKWGRWIALESSTRKRYWVCKCECGTVKEVHSANLTSGKSTSCGCYRKELGCLVRTHGMGQSAEYSTWEGMKTRCYNQNEPGYKNYGGRGIAVCDRWRDSFENFYADMGPRPSPEHSIDRFPNNDGNYEPGNCRWATKEEQANNTRTNRLLTIDG